MCDIYVSIGMQCATIRVNAAVANKCANVNARTKIDKMKKTKKYSYNHNNSLKLLPSHMDCHDINDKIVKNVCILMRFNKTFACNVLT